MGGLIIYGELSKFETEWVSFLTKNQLKHKKGKKFSEQELLSVNHFLVGKKVFPVATFFRLSESELRAVKNFSKLYEKSTYPQKKFKRIAAGSWLRKAHMTEVLGTGISEFITHIGGIKHAAINYDPISDTPGMREHIEEILYRNTSGVEFKENSILDPQVVQLLNRTQPDSWEITLEAKGILLDLADIICTMFGRYTKGEMSAPWDVLIIENRINERLFPLALGRDVTESVRNWLAELYKQREILEAYLPKK